MYICIYVYYTNNLPSKSLVFVKELFFFFLFLMVLSFLGGGPIALQRSAHLFVLGGALAFCEAFCKFMPPTPLFLSHLVVTPDRD